MDSTITAATEQIVREQETWAEFRRALRAEDRRAFDRVFGLARRHAAPLARVSRALPSQGIVLAAMVELLKRIDDLEQRIAAAERAEPPRAEAQDDLPLLP